MIKFHVAGYDDVIDYQILIEGKYIPREIPWIDGGTDDSHFEVNRILAVDSNVDLSIIAGMYEWAEMVAIKRIENHE